MSDFITSLIRTYVPIAVGAVISWLTVRDVNIDPNTQLNLVLALTGLLQAAYYTLVRLLEKQFPQLGFLLGSNQQPNYKEIK